MVIVVLTYSDASCWPRNPIWRYRLFRNNRWSV